MNSDASQNPSPDLRHFSHDLRNLLSALSMNTQILELSLKQAGMEQELEIVQAIGDSVKKIEALLVERIDDPAGHQSKP
jgi:signal transduction histidine kinase